MLSHWKKVDQDGKDLKGAVFTLPFYVNSTGLTPLTVPTFMLEQQQVKVSPMK